MAPLAGLREVGTLEEHRGRAMRKSEPWSLGLVLGLAAVLGCWCLGASDLLAWKFQPKEGIFSYPRIDGVGYLTTAAPQGIGKVVTALAEKAVHIGEGEIVYLDVGAEQGIKVGDRLVAFSLYKPRELKGMRVVVIEARLLVTAVKEREAEAKVEDSYRSVSLGARVDRYHPMEQNIGLKSAVASLQGRIVWSYENLVCFGEGDVVFLDKGRAHGVEPGQCYEVFRTPMENSESPPWKGKSPREHLTPAVGELIILRSEERTSAALVRKSVLPLEVGDRFRAGCQWEKDIKAARASAPPVASAPGQEDAVRRAWQEFEDKDVLYPYDSYVLGAEARAVLEEKARFLQRNPDLRVLIEGHCDERGTREYNLALGDRRAQAAKRYLERLGVAPERMRTISYGKERPVDPGHDESAWSRNRRAHFVLQGS